MHCTGEGAQQSHPRRELSELPGLGLRGPRVWVWFGGSVPFLEGQQLLFERFRKSGLFVEGCLYSQWFRQRTERRADLFGPRFPWLDRLSLCPGYTVEEIEQRCEVVDRANAQAGQVFEGVNRKDQSRCSCQAPCPWGIAARDQMNKTPPKKLGSRTEKLARLAPTRGADSRCFHLVQRARSCRPRLVELTSK